MGVKLLIADDHESVRAGLKNFLVGSDIKIIGEASTGDGAVKLVQKHSADVVLLDVRMPEGDGLTALSRIKAERPKLPVLMFSAFDNPAFVARCVALGANGYLLKTASKQQLISAIQKVADGSMLWERSELRRASGSLSTPRSGLDIEITLTHRECEVIKLVADGATNKDIAKKLNISYETVKEHVQHTLRKLGVSDRTQAALWAVRKGVV